MSYRLRTGLANISAGEIDWAWLPRHITRKYPVVLPHGASTPDQWCGQGWAACDTLAARLANAGFVCVSGYLGTNSGNTADPWANDTHMARITSARTFAQGFYTTAPTKVHLVGVSMGGGAAYRWASLNPTLAASVLAMLPMANLTAIYTANNPIGSQAGIGTAWAVTYPTPLPSGANLVPLAPAMAGVVPNICYYATNDPYVAVADVQALATAAGGTSAAVPTSQGHANASVASLSQTSLISWLVTQDV